MPARFRCALPFGADVLATGGVRFRLWAPAEPAVSVALEAEGGRATYPMTRGEDGWFDAVVHDASPGSLYRYRLADGFLVPDPASRFQPADVHGPSEVIEPASHLWRHGDWRGRPWEETVLCEVHPGCFGPEPGFEAVLRRLDHLAAVGVTAVELMPLADFEGRRNWGYDGVLPFAPDAAYGRPEDLKRLVDEAHGRGLMVFLDVVYNHFGPSGNYLARYAPAFFTDRHHTPWGQAIDFDGPSSRQVRAYFAYNALYWLEEYRIDGLRLDAVHAIRDDSRPHILEEIASLVRATIDPARHVHLVLENDDNAARYLERRVDGRAKAYTAQWNDDFHHAAHVLATGESGGYYSDYSTDPVAAMGRVLAEGFAYQGEASKHRGGRRRGEPSGHLPPGAFVAFLQNHDQIGNRAFGERLGSLAQPAAVETLTAVLLLSPQIPLLFMGEEWNSRRPFQFFCDFSGELGAMVRDGRRREFERFPAFADPELAAGIPDPNAPATFEASRLDWSEPEQPAHRAHLALVKRLLEIRRREILPLGIGRPGVNAGHEEEKAALRVHWRFAKGGRLGMVANLSAGSVEGLSWPTFGRRIHATADFPEGELVKLLPPWSLAVFVGADDRLQ